MNIERKYNAQTKRLQRLLERNESQKNEIENLKAKLIEVDELIEELNAIRDEWVELIEDTKMKQEEYNILIAQLKILRKGLLPK